jgi:hypothetical protein
MPRLTKTERSAYGRAGADRPAYGCATGGEGKGAAR